MDSAYSTEIELQDSKLKNVIKTETIETKILRYYASKQPRTNAIKLLVTDYIRNEMLSYDFNEMWLGKWNQDSKHNHVSWVISHIKNELTFIMTTDKTYTYSDTKCKFWKHNNVGSVSWCEPNEIGKYVLSLVSFIDDMKDKTYFRIVDSVIDKIDN